MPTLKFSLSCWLACNLRQRPVWSHNASVMEPKKYSVWNDDFLRKGDSDYALTHTCEGAKYKGKILCDTPFKRRSE